MKTIGKLKLNQLSKAELDKRELNSLIGGNPVGDNCGCGCYYAGSGGSSSVDNTNANIAGGYVSRGCDGHCYITSDKWNYYGGLSSATNHAY